MSARAPLLALAFVLGAASAAGATRAETHFRRGTAALTEGRTEEAIVALEAYADVGRVHPAASFNRGLAYLARIRADQEQPGDLGRAAAAFEEARDLADEHEASAEALLLRIRAEVARRRARRGQEAVLAEPSLSRLILGLASERWWAAGAIVGSLLLTLGLWLRRRPGSAHVAGLLISPVGALAALSLTLGWYGARDLRLHTKGAVVVARELRLLDAGGAALPGPAIPEATRLEVRQRAGARWFARYGTREGWVDADAIRVLRRR